MKKIYVFIFLITFALISYPQSNCKISIRVKTEVIDRFINFHLGEFNKKLDNGYTIKGTLETCKGLMNIEIYNEDSILINRGSFIESLDTLSHYVSVFTVDFVDTEEIVVTPYFQPLKNGIWYFYDEKGNFFSKKMYQSGVIMNKSNKY